MTRMETHCPIAVPPGRKTPGPTLLLKLLLGIWVWGVMTTAPSFAGEDPPVSAPRFSVPSLDGRQLTLEDFKGKYLLVNFWATWCGPCKVEMPSLELLHRKFHERDLTVMAVSNDIFGAKVVEPYIQEQNFTFTVALDPELQVSNQFGVISLPTTFLIDRRGKIIGVLNGAENWADPKTLLYFDQLLQTPVPATETQQASPCQKDPKAVC